MTTSLRAFSSLPGYEIVQPGLRDLRRQRWTIEALMVALSADRLRRLGIEVPSAPPFDPVEAVHDALERTYGDEEHARYNALRDRLLSFLNAAEGRR